MIKKILAGLITLLLFSVFPSVAEDLIIENEFEDDYKSLPFLGKKYSNPKNISEFIESVDFTVSFSNGVYSNPYKTIDNKLVSSPSPVLFPFTIATIWPNYTFIAMEPSLTFFMMYHLLYDSMALPSEIENRTSNTLSFIFNFPVTASFFFSTNKIQLKAGPAFMMRFGIPSVEGVDKEVEDINKWFWSKARFFYLSTGAAWLYEVSKNVKFGPEFNIYFPVGNLIAGEGVEGLVSTVGFKISF